MIEPLYEFIFKFLDFLWVYFLGLHNLWDIYPSILLKPVEDITTWTFQNLYYLEIFDFDEESKGFLIIVNFLVKKLGEFFSFFLFIFSLLLLQELNFIPMYTVGLKFPDLFYHLNDGDLFYYPNRYFKLKPNYYNQGSKELFILNSNRFGANDNIFIHYMPVIGERPKHVWFSRDVLENNKLVVKVSAPKYDSIRIVNPFFEISYLTGYD